MHWSVRAATAYYTISMFSNATPNACVRKQSFEYKMLVKYASQSLPMTYQDVDMLKYKENNFDTQCVLPKRIKRNLPPLPEDGDSSCSEIRKSKLLQRKRRQRRLGLPVLHEKDECWLKWSFEVENVYRLVFKRFFEQRFWSWISSTFPATKDLKIRLYAFVVRVKC